MSHSQSKTASTSSTTSNPVSLQDVEGLQIIGNGGPVNLTDGGAIQGSLSLAGLTVEKAAELTLALVAEQTNASREAMDKGLSFAMDAGRSDVATMQDMSQKAMMIVGIIAAAWVLREWVK